MGVWGRSPQQSCARYQINCKGAHQPTRSTRQATGSYHQATRSARQATGSSHQATRSAHQATSSAHQATRSAHQATRSAHHATRSAHQANRSAHQATRSPMIWARGGDPSGISGPQVPRVVLWCCAGWVPVAWVLRKRPGSPRDAQAR
jgi:hypothetical protein